MTNCVLAWNNYAVSGAVSVSSSAAGMGADRLQSPIGSSADAWQTPAGTTSGDIIIDCGAASVFRAYGVFRTNLTSSATIQLRASNSSGFSPLVYDSTALAANVAFGQSAKLLPSDQTARYLKITITDNSNPDGFINVPLAFVGSVWIPARNFTFSSSYGRLSNSKTVTTQGGQVYAVRNWQQRSFSMELGAVQDSEIWTQLMPLDDAARSFANILCIPRPDLSNPNLETIFGILTPGGKLTYAQQSKNTRGYSAEISERL